VNEGLLDFPEVCLDAVVHDAAGNESPAEQDCIVAHDTAASLSPLRRCGVAPTTEWSGALLGLLVLILRRRTITGRTA
jgi:hypothetical protein